MGTMFARVVEHKMPLESHLILTKIQNRVKMMNKSPHKKGEK
jgi:hypothetical protein